MTVREDFTTQVREAIADVHDPCCREKGISVVEMGLLRSAHRAHDGGVRVELLLTSGWCPFAATVLTAVRDKVAALPGVTSAEVEVSGTSRGRRIACRPGPGGCSASCPTPSRCPTPAPTRTTAWRPSHDR
jgi:metal-sulfur cluster biosynthetic enzyme